MRGRALECPDMRLAYLFFSSRNYWRWLCRILLGKETVARLYLASFWMLGYTDAICDDKSVKEGPGADPKANVPSYWERCYETALPQVWAVTGVIAAARWHKP